MSLGSIVVRLTMQTADFETDAGRAAKVAQRRAKEIDDAFRKAGTAIGVALGAGLAAAGVAMKRAVDHMDEVSKAAQKVQMPTEDFSRLVYAGGLADVQMDALTTTLGRLTKSQAASLKSTSEQAKYFDALGISAKNADGSLRNSSDVLLDFADAFAAMGGGPEAMAAGFALFGKSFQDLIPLIKDGSGAMREAMAEADALGITLSTEAGQAAEEFNDNITRLQTALGGVVMEIASGMLPQLNAMTGELVSASKETDTLRSFGEGLAMVMQGIGEGFSFVAGMARQFTIDALALSDALLGYAEVARNVASLGLAPGTVAGGMNRADSAWKTRSDMTRQTQLARQNAQAQAEINRLLANGVKYDGPLLAGMGGGAGDGDAMRKRLAAMLSRTGGGAKKAGRSGKSEAERQAEEAARAAKEAAEAQARWHSTVLDMEATLAGPMAEAQREYERNVAQLNEDFNEGHVALADYARALDAYASTRDKEIEAINARKTPAQEMLADMEFERQLIGKTREEQELLNAARYLGAEAATAQGKAALEAMADNQRAAKAMSQHIEAMDAFRSEGSNFLQDIGNGVKPIDALTDALDSLASKLRQMIADNLMERFFGQMGSASTGSSGGGIWNLLGNLFGTFLGGSAGTTSAASSGQYGWMANGYASGGFTGHGGMNQPAGIVHRGEVVWSQGDIARAGGVAAVEAMRRGRLRAGSTVINVNVPRNTSYETAEQSGAAAYAGASRAARRNGA